MSNLSFLLESAIAKHKSGHVGEAIDVYQTLLHYAPQDPQILFLLGTAYTQLRKPIQGLAFFDQALSFNPYNVDVLINRGIALKDLHRFSESLESFSSALKMQPAIPVAHNNRGNALQKMKRLMCALADYDKAIELDPYYAEAYCNRGIALQEFGMLEDAIASYDMAIKVQPDYADAYSNRAGAFHELGMFEDALYNYEKALALRSDVDYLLGARMYAQMQLCEWECFDEQVEELVDKVVQGEKVCRPFALLSLVDAPDLHRKASEIYQHEFYEGPFTNLAKMHAEKKEKIRLGYFSADFHDHATMHLLAEMLEKHDKNNFELFAFSFGPITHDYWQERIKIKFDEFIVCNEMSDAEVAKTSRDLGIDVAIDLKGYTQGSRPGIFSFSAAPIQVNFLGYPSTMGVEFIDYLIADRHLVSPESVGLYSEKIVWMPDCYQPNCKIRAISEARISRSQFGLPESGVVFASFNNNYKITPNIFSCWMRILAAVDSSVLWLLSTNAKAAANLKLEAALRGIDPERLIFAERVPIEDHLNRLSLADLMLDTFPYGAHTTCSDALRMCLPVITIAGKSFASRVSASLLNAVMLPELVTFSDEDYERLAVELARNAQQLKDIREKLSVNLASSPLFDSSLFVKNIETAYAKMVENCQRKRPKDHIKVN